MKGIMFDMDNTLLRSRINFKLMRQDLISLLVKHQVGTRHTYAQTRTAAEVIERGRKLLKDGDQFWLEEELFKIVRAYEEEGMKGATLEEGADILVSRLKKRGAVLAVVTNNSYEPACLALDQLGILTYFHTVVGREQMEALKPSPSGLHYVMRRHPEVKEWVMVGDSWIDGEAARQAGVGFVAFQGEREEMQLKGLHPLAQVHDYSQLGQWLDEWLNSDVKGERFHVDQRQR